VKCWDFVYFRPKPTRGSPFTCGYICGYGLPKCVGTLKTSVRTSSL